MSAEMIRSYYWSENVYDIYFWYERTVITIIHPYKSTLNRKISNWKRDPFYGSCSWEGRGALPQNSYSFLPWTYEKLLFKRNPYRFSG